MFFCQKPLPIFTNYDYCDARVCAFCVGELGLGKFPKCQNRNIREINTCEP
jgi:hypothetical protein